MTRAGDLLLYGAALLDGRRAAGRRESTGRARRAPSEAVWVRDGRIAAVGPLAAIRSRAGRNAARIDLGGGTLTPGFTDSHIHLVTWIRALREPWLADQSVASIERAVRERIRSAPREDWILLRGWIPREWPAEQMTRSTLDRVAPDRPLVLHAVDGHSVWANSAALRRAAIDDQVLDPLAASSTGIDRVSRRAASSRRRES